MVSLILLLTVGCAGNPVIRGREAAMNRSNLAALKIGMTGDEAAKLMGKPSEIETFTAGGNHLEFWHYRTEHDWLMGSVEDTALVFEEGVLKEWGLGNYYERPFVQPENRIEQKIMDSILVLPPYDIPH